MDHLRPHVPNVLPQSFYCDRERRRLEATLIPAGHELQGVHAAPRQPGSLTE